jgi:DNA-binding NarL/FixJ family response regulator
VALLIHADDNRASDVPESALQHLLGLTPCETTIALRLARGMSVKEVSRDLGVSLSTTRTHLRSIFLKTGIDKQTKLVRAVLQGMAVLSCR